MEQWPTIRYLLGARKDEAEGLLYDEAVGH